MLKRPFQQCLLNKISLERVKHILIGMLVVETSTNKSVPAISHMPSEFNSGDNSLPFEKVKTSPNREYESSMQEYVKLLSEIGDFSHELDEVMVPLPIFELSFFIIILALCWMCT